MYPLISEYIEAIKSAEENFEELSSLRPVLDNDGLPVMTSGNFAVVFKMQDKETGKLYALKCFTKEQEGRTEAYHQIADELKDVDSPYLVSLRYLDKELFVDTKQTDETEFPVLLMDWVEGKTLDKYLRENLDDKYALEMLAYRFSQLAQWLIPQPFAHGDLKPDNILVREDGTLVLVDYDGMYVPAMKGQKARELGSPDFQHPLRNKAGFNEFVDDFSIATILFSLNHIAKEPSLLSRFGANNRLLLCQKDYYNIKETKIIQHLYPDGVPMDFDFFILEMTIHDGYFKNVELSWFSLINKPLESVAVAPRKVSVLYNGSSITMIYVEGGAFIMGSQKKSTRLPNYDHNANNNEGPVRECKVNGFWISESLVTRDVWPSFADNPDGIYPYNIRERNKYDNLYAVSGVTYDACLGFMRGLSMATNIRFDFPTEEEWEFAARGGVLSNGYKYAGAKDVDDVAVYKEELDGYGTPILKVKTKKPNELGIYDMSGGLFEWCKDSVTNNLQEDVSSSHKYHIIRGGCITGQAEQCRVSYRTPFYEYNENEEYWWSWKPSLWQVGLRLVARNIDLSSIENNEIRSFSDEISEAENISKTIDTFGAEYSGDKLIKIPDDIVEYSVKEGTVIVTREPYCDSRDKKIGNIHFPTSLKVIGWNAFWGCKHLHEISIPNGVFRIGGGAFANCESLTRIVLPNTIKYIENGAFAGCCSLREITIPEGVEILEDGLFSFCSNLVDVIIPTSVITICEDVFWYCTKINTLTLPEKVRQIEKNPFRESGIEEIVCGSPHFVFENGILMTADRKKLIACLTNKKYVLVPSSIEIIQEYAFYGCRTIERLFLPEGISEIGDFAIGKCDSLVEIILPSTIQRVKRGFLSECPHIKRLIIHSKNIWIDFNSTFYKAKSLSKIIIPQEIKEVFAKQFPDYTEITESY